MKAAKKGKASPPAKKNKAAPAKGKAPVKAAPGKKSKATSASGGLVTANDLAVAVLAVLSETPGDRYSADGLLDALAERGILTLPGPLTETLTKLRDECEIDECAGRGGWEYLTTAEQVAQRAAESPLGLAICRALGEAHEGLFSAAIWAKVRRGPLAKVTQAQVIGELDRLVPIYVRREGPLYYTARSEEAPPAEPAPVTARTGEEAPPAPALPAETPSPAPSTLPSFAELLERARASGEGTMRRINRPLSDFDREALETERAAKTKRADELVSEAKAETRRAKAITKTLRQGFTVDKIRVAAVPDFERNKLVSVALNDGLELAVRRLPGRYRQASLPFPAASGGAS